MTAIFAFVKRCLLLGILFFALLGFQGKADATTYFIEDFNTLEIGRTSTYIVNSTNLIRADSSITENLLNDYGVSLLNNSYTQILKSKNIENISSGYAYFTFISEYQQSTNWNSIILGYNDYGQRLYIVYKLEPSLNRIAIGYLLPSGEEYSYSYLDIKNPNLTGLNVFNFKIQFDMILNKFSVWVNNELAISEATGWGMTGGQYINNFQIVNEVNGTLYDTGIDNIALIDSSETPFIPELPEVPYYWLDWCGNDAGKFLETTPTDLCDIGNASAVVFDGAKWSWDCVDGVVSQNCRSYISTTLPVDGVCGTWAGETFDVWPAKTQLCDPSASLIEGTMTETINGWSWGCAGFNGGSNSVCFADKGVGTSPVFPELPSGAIDDCDGLPLLEGLVCKIGNTIKQIFLPSSEKLNELNQTINKIATKFPFSYISIATDTIKEVGVKINETGDFEMSLLGGEKKSIDFNRIPFAEHIKGFTTTLFILFFLFWLVRYIRNVF